MLAVKLDACRDAAAEEIRLGCRQIDPARVLAVGRGGAERFAGAQKVAVTDFDLGEKAIGRRVPSGNRELAGRLFRNLNIEHNTIRHRARLRGNLDGLEIVQILQAPLGAIDQRLVVGIALGDVEFTPDHVAPGTHIAVDIDALDIGSRPLIDRKRNVDAPRVGIVGGAGEDLREGKTELGELDRENFGGLVQRAAVEHRAGPRHKHRTEFFGIQSRHIAHDGDVAEMIERSFIDRKRQRKSAFRWIVFGLGRSNAGVGIALATIVQSQLLAIGRDTVGVVFIAAGQKAQHVGGGSLDHGGKLPFAEHPVADKIDLPHRRLRPLRHHIDEIEPVVTAIDDLRHDADIVAPGMPIGFHDAADVGLHHGALQCAARLGLDDGRKVLVFYFLVALERDAVEHRGLGQTHNQPLAGAVDRNIVEQTGCQQRLERCIAGGVVEPPVRSRMEIRTHRLGVDAAIALHGDSVARLRAGFGRESWRRKEPERGDQQRDRCSRPAAPPARRPAIPDHVPPVCHLTGWDPIAWAGQKNVGDKVSCRLKR